MKNTLYILLFLGFTLTSYGQQTIRPNIYFQDMNYYNPSAIALDTTDNFSYSLYAKHKIIENESEIWNKPVSIFLNHIGRIKNSFYTISYTSDRYSFFDRNTLNLGYTYQKKWGKSNILSLGGRAILNFDVINWSKYKTPHSEIGKALKFNPDIDLGIQYQISGFSAGISSKNVLSWETKLEGQELLKNQREFYFNTSYLFKLGKNFQIVPYILLHKERNLVIDGGVYISLFNRVGASYLFRINELRSIYTLDVKVYKRIHVGVAFDHSKLLPDNNLDLVLRYNF